MDPLYIRQPYQLLQSRGNFNGLICEGIICVRKEREREREIRVLIVLKYRFDRTWATDKFRSSDPRTMHVKNFSRREKLVSAYRGAENRVPLVIRLSRSRLNAWADERAARQRETKLRCRSPRLSYFLTINPSATLDLIS